MKLVLINSFGPMGSTSIAAIIEKFGFQNIPLRKINLTESVIEDTNKNKKIMFNNFKNTIESHNNFKNQGGVSAIVRNNDPKIRLIDITKIADEVKSIKYNDLELPSLYFRLREIYQKSILYKKNNQKKIGYIELLINSHNFDPDFLIKSYKKKFDKVYVINIKRDFLSWLSSLTLQWYFGKNSKWRFLKIDHVYSDYLKYENFVNNSMGLEINFDDIFLPKTFDLINKLESYLDVDITKVDWESEQYDLYGKISNFEKSFNKYDDNINILSNLTKKFIILKISKSKNSYLLNICVIMLYFLDSLFIKFKIKTK